jgi:hypothetical protein
VYVFVKVVAIMVGHDLSVYVSVVEVESTQVVMDGLDWGFLLNP